MDEYQMTPITLDEMARTLALVVPPGSGEAPVRASARRHDRSDD